MMDQMPPVAWQVIWPALLHLFVMSVIASLAGPVIGMMWTVFFAGMVTSFILYPLYRRRMRENGRPFGHTWRVRMNPAASWLFIAVMAAAACLLLNHLIALCGMMGFSKGYEEAAGGIYSVPIWIQMLVTGAAAPVAEELVFRGMGYACLRTRMGTAPAAVISALFFGLYHGNLVQAVYAFGLGIMLAVIYEHFDGLPSAVFFHVAANVAAVVLTALAGRFSLLFENQLFTVVQILVCVLILTAAFIRIYSGDRRDRR